MSPIAIGARRLFVLVALVLRISLAPIATAQEYVPRTLSVAEGLANVAPENPIWVTFARAMVPFMAPIAAGLAQKLAAEPDRPSTDSYH